MKRPKKSTPSDERVLPSMHVSGKTALVTGAGSGLGKSIALALAEAGADVAITELPSRMENARAVATSIRALGRNALVVKLDVTSVKNIQRAVDAVVNSITAALKKGQQVSVVGFGTFGVKHRAARSGRNPRTGETIQIAASNVPGFKAGKALKDAVN